MKKWIAFVLILGYVLGLAGCSNNEVKIWDWTYSLSQEDIISAIPRSGVDSDERIEFEPLNDEETLELVTLLHKLTKDSFTENKKLTGGTPTFHIEINIASETYYINEYNGPNGTLEIKYNEEQWLIDNAALTEFIKRVTNNKPIE